MHIVNYNLITKERNYIVSKEYKKGYKVSSINRIKQSSKPNGTSISLNQYK